MKIIFLKNNKRKYKNIKNIFVSLFIIFGLLFSSFLSLTKNTEAALNKEINYQGKLTLASGVAVPNTNYTIVFSLYTAPTGGTALWTETRTVPVNNGLFSEMLGSSSSLASVDFNQTLYLGVKVGSDSEMTPRKKLGVVPAAIVSETVTNASQPNITSLGTLTSLTMGGSLQMNENLFAFNQSGVRSWNLQAAAGNLAFTSGDTLGALTFNGNNIWHSGNDGSTSGLDADLLDGHDTAYFQQALTNPVTGTGTANYIAKFSSTGSAIGNSLIYDNGTNVGIGTTGPGMKLDVQGSIGVLYGDGTKGLQASDAGFTNKYLIRPYYSSDSHDTVGIYTPGNESNTEKVTIKGNGLVGIGTTSPGYKLDVAGSIRTDNQLISTIATGTAPFVVASTTVNTNLNADLLDGQHSSAFALSSHDHSRIISKGILTPETGRTVNDTGIYTYNVNNASLGDSTPTQYWSVSSWGNGTGGSAQLAASWTNGGNELYFRSLRDYSDNWYTWKKIWHEGNDGSGSTLDADLLDGHDTSYFQTALTNPVTGTGTANYLPKFTGASTIGNSIIYDDGTNVGIGTTSPQSKLHVASGNTGVYTALVLQNINNESSGQGVRLKFKNSNFDAVEENKYGFIDYISESNYGEQGFLAFGTNNGYNSPATEKMRITSGGNVGIGTTSPGQKLEVAGNIVAGAYNSARVQINQGGGSQAVTEYYLSETNPRWALGRDTIASGQSGVAFSDNSGTIQGSGVGIGYTGTSRNLGLYTSNGSALTERVRVDGNGNVGIGTTAPGSILSIVKSSTYNNENSGGMEIASGLATTNAKLILGTVGDNYSYIQSMQQDYDWTSRPLSLMPNGGNVGIGTTNPQQKLDINGMLQVRASGVDNNAPAEALRFNIPNYDGSEWINSIYSRISAVGAQSMLKFSLANGNNSQAEVMTLLGSGNVGIGTTNPSLSKLEVNGGIRILTTPSDVYGSGVIFKDETSSTEWSLHSHGDRLRTYNGSTELTYVTTGDLAGVILPTGTEGQTLYNNAGAWTANSGLFYDDVNGRVGIGTTGPQSKLEVKGSSVYDSPKSITLTHAGPTVYSGFIGLRQEGLPYTNLTFGTRSAGVDYMETLNIGNGNVGIGTTSPTAKLDVVTRTEGLLATFRPHSDVITYTADSFINVGYGYPVNIGTNYNTGDPYGFVGLNGTKSIYLKATGNVGIGTTDPGSYKLNVAGMVNINSESSSEALSITGRSDDYSNIIFKNANGTPNSLIEAGNSKFSILTYTSGAYNNRISVDVANGNVGIGAITPGTKLDVDGAIRTNNQFISTLATGTAPLAVTSTTVNTNLNADYLDGYHMDINATASTVVARDASGFMYGSYINSNRGSENSAAAQYIYDTGDGWMRKKDLANVKSEIVTSAAVISGLGNTPVYISGTQDRSGNLNMYSTNTAGLYSEAAIELREANLVTTAQSSWAYAPSIAFHWGGRNQTQLKMLADGTLALGTGDGVYTGFRASTGSFSGALTSTTLDTGQGAYELYAMNQNVLTTSTPTFANVAISAGHGSGLCFWQDCLNYKISMGSSSEFTYGPVTGGYSIKSTMGYNSGWGFSWGSPGNTPVAALEVTTGNMQIAGSMAANAFNGPGTGLTGTASGLNIGGNASTATTFSTNRTNYKGVTDGAVAGQLMWKNYGNNHTIFDASAGTSPSGSAVNRYTPDYPVDSSGTNSWGESPSLMGWNGSNTYGVRVDYARNADLLDGRHLVGTGHNGTEWDRVPLLKADGVMEIGKYLDFHDGTNDGIDFVNRITSNGSGSLLLNSNTVWHAGNDGSGSTLDADTLDNYNPSTSATANTIALRDANGDLSVRELVLNVASQSFTPSSIVAIYPTTNQAVKVNAAGVAAFISGQTMNIGGNAETANGAKRNYLGNLGTIGATKTELINQMNGAGRYAGSALSFNGYWGHVISEWNNDSVTIPASSDMSFFRLDSYSTSSYGTWLVASYANNDLYYVGRNNENWTEFYKIWSSGNDGSGSTLDADLLDGLHAASFDQSNTNEIQTLGTSGNTITLTSGGSVTAPYATNAGNATAVVNTVAGTGSIELVRGNMADNDQFRILVGGTSTNEGFAEIATADDGTEPIYVRQYTGVFGSLTRSATLLDAYGNTSFPGSVTAGSINIGSTNVIDSSRNLVNIGTISSGAITSGLINGQTISNAANFTGTANVVGTLAAGRFFQNADGVPTNNLGNPSVTEMALFQEQFNNKTSFYDISKLKFYSYNGSSWSEVVYSDENKRKFLGGDNDSGIVIPNLSQKFRIELENNGAYVSLNALYMYWSSNSHSTQVHIWAKDNLSQNWRQVTNSTNYVSSWPGHLYLPFPAIWFLNTPSGSHDDTIRIEFTPSWSGDPTYGSSPISLMKMQIWGGYPSGKRTIYATDENQNVTFPAAITGSSSSTIANNKALNISQTGATAGTDYSGYFSNTGASTTNIGLYATASGAANNYAAIFDAGNVGIGTTTPTGNLEIKNTSTTNLVLNSTTGSNQIQFQNNGTVRYYVWNTGNDYLGMGVGGSTNSMFVASTGYVGIGVVNPQQKLWVQDGSIWLTGNSQKIGFSTDGSTDATPNASIIATENGLVGASADLIFNTWNGSIDAEIMRLRSNGNVGIGTTTPNGALQLGADLTATTLWTRNYSYTSKQWNTISDGSTDGLNGTIGLTLHNNNTTDGNWSRLAFSAYEGTGGNNVVGAMIATRFTNREVNGWVDGDLAFSTNYNSGLIERMRILANGNVGIGTTGPATKLELQDTAATVLRMGVSTALVNSKIGAMEFRNGNNSYLSKIESYTSDTTYPDQTDLRFFTTYQTPQERMRITSGGNVGIGTTNPLDTLTVKSPSAEVSTLRFEGNTVDTQNAQIIFNKSGTNSLDIRTNLVNNANKITLSPGASTAMTLLGSGNVGIGTTGPWGKLDVYDSGATGIVTILKRGIQGSETTLPTTFGYPYLAIGGSEYKTNSIQSIGFGYKNTAAALQPAEIGFVDTNTGGNTLGDLVFATRDTGNNVAPSERMRITSTGNVGVGTTAPTARLQALAGRTSIVTSNGSYTGGGYGHLPWGGLYSGYSSIPGDGLGAVYSGNGQPYYGGTAGTLSYGGAGDYTTGGGSGVTAFGGDGGYYAEGGAGIYAKGGANGGWWVGNYGVARAPAAYFDGNTFVMNGNMGVGTTAPVANLEIKSSLTTGFNRVLKLGQSNYSANGDGIYIDFGTSNTDGYGAQIGALRELAASEGSALVFKTGTTNTPSERMRINSAGNVGIGTTEPGSYGKLAVIGGDIATDSNLRFYGTTPTIFSSGYAYPIKIDGSSVLLNSGSGGNVGIGTTNPQYKLSTSNGDSIGSSVLHLSQQYISGSNAGWYGIDLYAVDNGLNGDDLRVRGRTTNTGGYTDLFTIKNSGNVGIGNTSPGAMLTIGSSLAGTTLSSTFVSNAGSLGGTSGNTLNLGNLGFISGNVSSLGVRAYRTAAGLDWTTSSVAIGMDVDNSNFAGGYLSFYNGKVGIGTTTPGASLDVRTADGGGINLNTTTFLSADSAYLNVNGRARFGYLGSSNAVLISDANTNKDILFQTDNTSRMIIKTSTGNVGIGTTTPGAPLAFADSEALKIQLNGNAANYYGISKAAAVNSGDSMFKITAGATTAGEIGFYTTTNARMLINKDGNVGIGDTTPAALFTVGSGDPFQVSSTGATTGLSFRTKNGSLYNDIYTTSSTGNSKLTVKGGSWTHSVYFMDSYNNTAYAELSGGSSGIEGSLVLRDYSAQNTIANVSTYASSYANVNGSITSYNGDICTTSYCLNDFSDERLKENVVGMGPVLDKVMNLRPIFYNWNNIYKDSHKSLTGVNSTKVGFIAQEMKNIFPEVVTGEEGEDTYLGINYDKLTPILTMAIQELNTNLNTEKDKIDKMNLKLGVLTGEIIPLDGTPEKEFETKFFDNLFVKIGDWLASADNGIKSIFARKISTRLLCVADEAGVETCVEKNQLDSLLASAGVASADDVNDTDGGVTTTIPTQTEVNPEAPVITLIGDATINLNIGDTYNELGANASDNKDSFVGVSINGVPDTSKSGIYAIHYTAVDTDGNNAIEVIRKVIVGEGDYTITGVEGDNWAPADTTPTPTTETTTVIDGGTETTVSTGFSEEVVSTTPAAEAPVTTEATPTETVNP